MRESTKAVITVEKQINAKLFTTGLSYKAEEKQQVLDDIMRRCLDKLDFMNNIAETSTARETCKRAKESILRRYNELTSWCGYTPTADIMERLK